MRSNLVWNSFINNKRKIGILRTNRKVNWCNNLLHLPLVFEVYPIEMSCVLLLLIESQGRERKDGRNTHKLKHSFEHFITLPNIREKLLTCTHFRQSVYYPKFKAVLSFRLCIVYVFVLVWNIHYPFPILASLWFDLI